MIPIGDKILFDELHAKGDSSFAKFYNVKPGTLLVKVHAGSINVALKYKNKTIESHFDRDRKVQRYDYNITRLPEDFTPININITSTSENTLYSIAL